MADNAVHLLATDLICGPEFSEKPSGSGTEPLPLLRTARSGDLLRKIIVLLLELYGLEMDVIEPESIIPHPDVNEHRAAVVQQCGKADRTALNNRIARINGITVIMVRIPSPPDRIAVFHPWKFFPHHRDGWETFRLMAEFLYAEQVGLTSGHEPEHGVAIFGMQGFVSGGIKMVASEQLDIIGHEFQGGTVRRNLFQTAAILVIAHKA